MGEGMIGYETQPEIKNERSDYGKVGVVVKCSSAN